MTSELSTEILWSDGLSERAAFECSTKPPWTLSLVLADDDRLSEEAADLFECLGGIRKQLAKRGGVVLCAGAQKNVFPSSMARDMGGGRFAYRLELGKQARRTDMIDILSPASADEIASVGEQRAFYDQWLASLKQD